MPDVRPLAAVAAIVSVLGIADAIPLWAGLLHQVALPPLDLFADVRVLLAEAPSYPWLVAILLVDIALRSIVLAAMLGVLDRGGVLRCLAFYGIALGPALVAGSLGFAGVAALYSVFLWLGVAVATITVLVMGPLPWRPEGRLWSGRLVVLGYLAPLLAVSLASALGSGAVQVALVWVSAGLTAVTLRWLSGRGDRASGRTAARAALVLLVVAVPLAAPAPQAERAAHARAGTLFLVPGIGGTNGTSGIAGLDPAALGFDCQQTAYFSYAGTGEGAPQGDARCPITSGAPYTADDTHRPLGELAATFRAQLAQLRPPVTVVAHSQGGWIAAAATGSTSAPGLGAVVLMGAFPRHERGYVLEGTGAGVVGTDALEGLTAALRAAGATSFDPRDPLYRELLGTPGAVDDLMRAGFRGDMDVATVTSAFDLPIMPRDWELDGATNLCPVYVHHGTLPVSPVVHRQIRQVLDDRDPGTCGWWRRWPTQAFAAFGVPSP
jgi:hypothetical protein